MCHNLLCEIIGVEKGLLFLLIELLLRRGRECLASHGRIIELL